MNVERKAGKLRAVDDAGAEEAAACKLDVGLLRDMESLARALAGVRRALGG